jgi:hypothetical protein
MTAGLTLKERLRTGRFLAAMVVGKRSNCSIVFIQLHWLGIIRGVCPNYVFKRTARTLRVFPDVLSARSRLTRR